MKKKTPVPGPYCDVPGCLREATLLWHRLRICIKRRCPKHAHS